MTGDAADFAYDVSVSRNLGWVTAAEQQVLRRARIAIAGLGGVGGAHLMTLTRLGIGGFSIADFDTFGIHNFNRQAGAFMSTVDLSKVEVMAAMASDVNPELALRSFPEGVTPENLSDFLDGVDLYVDGIDFFAMDARRMLFAAARSRGIPALTAAPLGMGVSLLYFAPDGMSFEDYFLLEGHERTEQFARFIAGLSPAMLQRHYLAEPDAVNFAEQRGPSTGMACDLCAGVMGVASLQVLLGRNAPRAVPWAMQFDAYRQQLRRTWRPFGNANPLQRMLLRMIRPRLAG